MAGSKKGERRGGRKPGSLNKATIERKERALQELTEEARAATAAGKKIVLAKDELFDLIPVIKGTVAEFQKAAIGEGGKGLPSNPGFDRVKWNDFREWVLVLENVCRHAAEFQSPKFKAIAVSVTDPGQPKEPARIIDAVPSDAAGRERAASAAYLKLVKG